MTMAMTSLSPVGRGVRWTPPRVGTQPDIEVLFETKPELIPQRRRRAVPVALLVAVVLMSSGRPTLAQTGVNLSWDNCGAFGAESKSFACNTNAGSSTMVGSFAAPPGIVCSPGLEMILDLETSGDVLPNWWMFTNAGTCRQNNLGLSLEFTAGPADCADYFMGSAGLALTQYVGPSSALNRARIILYGLDTFEVCFGSTPGVETYAFKLTLSHDKTVGSGSCGGCGDGVCVVLNAIKFYPSFFSGEVTLTTPLTRNYVTWQAGIPNCPAATPVRSRTWGAVKSLYR